MVLDPQGSYLIMRDTWNSAGFVTQEYGYASDSQPFNAVSFSNGPLENYIFPDPQPAASDALGPQTWSSDGSGALGIQTRKVLLPQRDVAEAAPEGARRRQVYSEDVMISPSSTEKDSDDPYSMGPSSHGKPRVDRVSSDRHAKLLDTERNSRYRKQNSAQRLKQAVEALSPELLDGLVDQVAPSPSSRHGLVQAEVFGYAAVIVERYPETWQLLAGYGELRRSHQLLVEEVTRLRRLLTESDVGHL